MKRFAGEKENHKRVCLVSIVNTMDGFRLWGRLLFSRYSFNKSCFSLKLLKGLSLRDERNHNGNDSTAFLVIVFYSSLIFTCTAKFEPSRTIVTVGGRHCRGQHRESPLHIVSKNINYVYSPEQHIILSYFTKIIILKWLLPDLFFTLKYKNPNTEKTWSYHTPATPNLISVITLGVLWSDKPYLWILSYCFLKTPCC